MGIIKEFTGLQIDDFRTHTTPPLLCLLSHAHSDHLLGLDRRSYYGPLVYCTATTRSLVLNIRGSNSAKSPLRYNHLRKENCGIEILQTLELGRSHPLRCGQLEILVTPIDAPHCPGSCMFLIQSQASAVLYTGDLRCELWYVNMLALNPFLIPYTLGNKSINLYMDNIYEQHHQQSLEYHSGTEGIEQLINLLVKDYPPATPFCALFTTIGYETVLVALADRLSTRIHMDPYYYQLYLSAADTCPLSRAIVERSTTNDVNSQCRLHWCKKGECSVRDRLDAVFFSPCVTISQAAVEERNNPLGLDGFEVNGHSDLPVYANAVTGARYILATDSHTLLPGHVLFYFSRHASQPCLRKLIETFTTKTVRSLDGQPMQGFSSFESSGKEMSTTDDSHQSPPPGLPLIRKQPMRLNNKPQKKPKFILSSSSVSHDDALMFLQSAGKQQQREPNQAKHQESTTKQEQSLQESLHVKEPSTIGDTMETLETQGEIVPSAREDAPLNAAPENPPIERTSACSVGPPAAPVYIPDQDPQNPSPREHAPDPATPRDSQLLDGNTWFSLKFDFQNQ